LFAWIGCGTVGGLGNDSTSEAPMQVPPFDSYLGTQVVRTDAGSAELAIDLEPHHLNMRGVAHGGVVTSLLDSALGAAVISAIPEEWWCATTSLATQFIGGAGEGRLVATAKVTHAGSKVAFASGEVRDEAGRLIATAHGSWHLWPRRPGTPRPELRDSILLRESGEKVRVGKILAVGRNYAAHVAEMGAPVGEPPVVFLKPATALVAGGGRVRIPTDAGEVHHEVELVVVIGKTGKAISKEAALDHVLGYAVGLDLTLRDLQSEAKEKRGPWSIAKGFDGSAPVSNVVLRDEVGDGSGLEISLDVNGERRQQGSTSMMLCGVAELIAHASRWMTLERGDLLFTGTPAGVGAVAPGDKLEARVERVGQLSVDIEAAG
jgi:uncharacterized protein (TIGR00369 family)